MGVSKEAVYVRRRHLGIGRVTYKGWPEQIQRILREIISALDRIEFAFGERNKEILRECAYIQTRVGEIFVNFPELAERVDFVVDGIPKLLSKRNKKD